MPHVRTEATDVKDEPTDRPRGASTGKLPYLEMCSSKYIYKHSIPLTCMVEFVRRLLALLNQFSPSVSLGHYRVPTQTGKPGKMGRHFPVREKSGNFEQIGKVRENHTKY